MLALTEGAPVARKPSVSRSVKHVGKGDKQRGKRLPAKRLKAASKSTPQPSANINAEGLIMDRKNVHSRAYAKARAEALGRGESPARAKLTAGLAGRKAAAAWAASAPGKAKIIAVKAARKAASG